MPFFCKADDDRRGRGNDEVPNMLSEQLQKEGIPEFAIQVIPDEQTAITAALEASGEGDFVDCLG